MLRNPEGNERKAIEEEPGGSIGMELTEVAVAHPARPDTAVICCDGPEA